MIALSHLLIRLHVLYKLHQNLLFLLLELKKKLWSISNAITMRTSF